MEEHGVKTTPQVFIGGERIGGYDDTRRHLGKPLRGEDETTYQPVIALFCIAFLMCLAVSWLAFGTVFSIRSVEAFIAIAMCLLGIQKFQDVESFSTMFLNYDLLARRYVPYAYFYTFGETLTGVLMLAGALMWIASPVALFIGTVGAVEEGSPDAPGFSVALSAIAVSVSITVPGPSIPSLPPARRDGRSNR